MSDPRPPRWLKATNKVMLALQKLGIPAGPVMVLTVPGRKSGGLVQQGTPEEFESLAGTIAVFRFDPVAA